MGPLRLQKHGIPTDEDGEKLKIVRTKQLFVGPNATDRERFNTAMEAAVGAILREVKNM
jgi:hypothetical protein